MGALFGEPHLFAAWGVAFSEWLLSALPVSNAKESERAGLSRQLTLFYVPIAVFPQSDSFDAAIILEVPDALFDGSRANA